MLKFFAPKFLKRLDDRLLLNSPILWISKLHYVVYYTLIMWILTAIIAFVLPINLSDMVSTGIYYTLFTIISIILLCVWLYKNAIFNIESDFGNRKWTDEYKVFFTYFLCIFLMFSSAYPFSIIYSQRIANQLTDEQMASDINTLNLAEPFFVTNAYHYFQIQYEKKDTIYDAEKDSSYVAETPSYIYKHDINRYISWNKYTPYRLVTDSTLIGGLLTATDQEKVFKQLKSNDAKALQAIQDYYSVLKRYQVDYTEQSPREVLNRYKSLCVEPIENLPSDNEYYSKSTYYYDNYRMETILRNVCDAKFDGLFVLNWEFNLFVFYFVFFITLIFMLFKSVRWQQFLITAVSFIVIPILLFILTMILSWGRGNDMEIYFMTGTLLIYLVAVAFSIAFFVKPTKFNAFKNICMQIVYVCTPFVFMYFVFYLDENTNVFHRHRYYDYSYAQTADVEQAMAIAEAQAINTAAVVDTSYAAKQLIKQQQLQEAIREADYQYHRQLFQNWIWGSIAFGFIFHIGFFMVFMKQQFLKMKALPRNR